MQVNVSSETGELLVLKRRRGGAKKRDVTALGVVGELDHIVGERAPPTALSNTGFDWVRLAYGSLARDLVEILQEVKSGKTNPADDEQNRPKPGAHGRQIIT
jgi:hypothetical protein